LQNKQIEQLETILVLLILANFVLLVIGLISPKTSLFWHKHERTRKKSIEIYGIFLITFIIVLGLWLTA
jgi:predicted nucleic acid-binding Zn ribbon protein